MTRNLEIVFTKSKKKLAIVSKLIMLWTKKPYSHVARKLVVHGGIELYYQASGSQVNYECKEVFDTKHEIVLTRIIQIPSEIYMEIGNACLKEAGKPYGYMQNLGIALVDLCSFFGVNIQNPWKKGLNCSELLYITVLKRMYPELNYNPNTIKPHHIDEIIERIYGK